MFRALVELGRELERKGELPSPGYYHYSDPIRWTVNLWPDHIHLEQTELPLARPASGRTSQVEEHLLADEAGYVLGVEKTKKHKKNEEPIDKRASEKHQRFRDLIAAFQQSDALRDDALRQAVDWLVSALDEKSASSQPRFGQMLSEDWVSFVPQEGALGGTHLFEHPQAKAFWLAEMQRRCASKEGKSAQDAEGDCAVCGRKRQKLIRKLPLGVKLAANTPLHSLNESAFTSFIGGGSTDKKAHLGLCFECGDTAARAFNFLSSNSQHRRWLYSDQRKGKRDKLSNQVALFWMRAPVEVVVTPVDEAPITLNFNDLTQLDVAAVMQELPQEASPKLAQLRELVSLPWKPKDSAIGIRNDAFYLAVLSPNVGRIAVREWFSVSIDTLKDSLRTYLDSVQMVSAWGDTPRPSSIGVMAAAIGVGDPNLTRELLRCAYGGASPPGALASLAGRRLNHLLANETSLRERQRGRGRDQTPVWREDWPQALAAAVKLGLFYGTEEVEAMSEVNQLYSSSAYQCGRLLALLEEAQQRYQYAQYRNRLKTSTVVRSYGAASVAPLSTFGRLLQTATTAHLPRAGRINQNVEEVVGRIVELGGMPAALSPAGQAEFGLGFYQERAQIRRNISNDRPEEANAPLADEESE